MAIGALLKVLNFVIVKTFYEVGKDWAALDTIKIDHYKQKLAGLESIDFGTNGPYGKTSSEGGLSKLKNDIILSLPYFGSFQNIKEFETDFKNTYLKTFNDAVNEVAKLFPTKS